MPHSLDMHTVSSTQSPRLLVLLSPMRAHDGEQIEAVECLWAHLRGGR
jgi:hypothetical protein